MKDNFCKYLVNERTPDEGFAQSCIRKDKHFITIIDEERDCTRDIMCDHYDNSRDLTIEERVARLETAFNELFSTQDDKDTDAVVAMHELANDAKKKKHFNIDGNETLGSETGRMRLDTECEDKDMCDGDCNECRNGETSTQDKLVKIDCSLNRVEHKLSLLLDLIKTVRDIVENNKNAGFKINMDKFCDFMYDFLQTNRE